MTSTNGIDLLTHDVTRRGSKRVRLSSATDDSSAESTIQAFDQFSFNTLQEGDWEKGLQKEKDKAKRQEKVGENIEHVFKTRHNAFGHCEKWEGVSGRNLGAPRSMLGTIWLNCSFHQLKHFKNMNIWSCDFLLLPNSAKLLGIDPYTISPPFGTDVSPFCQYL